MRVPPKGWAGVEHETHAIPFGRAVHFYVRALDGHVDDAEALVLAWCQLSNVLRGAGVPLEEMLAHLPGQIEPPTAPWDGT